MNLARTSLVAAVLGGVFVAIYADALGHGFVKDDFRWIATADVRSAADLGRVFSTNVGFYRPLVTTTFAIDRAIWKFDPRGYALTNLILLLADAGLLFLVARQLVLPSSAALFAVAVWIFNFHGINMALLWISGRTALLLCLFSLGAVVAWLEGRRVAGALLTLAAMLCKEEAVMLPPLLVLFDLLWTDGDRDTRLRSVARGVMRAWPLWAATAIYLTLRIRSGAFGLSDAPSYYRLTFDPRAVLKNAAEYLDRGATWPVVAGVLMFVAAPRGTPLNSDERRVIRFGFAWFASMFAITLFAPVRSSLYAVAPSIGTALAAAGLASRAQRSAPHRFQRVSAGLIAAVTLLIPVYRTRNHGLVEPADLSTQALAAVQQAAQNRPSVREIVLIDDAHAAVNLDDAFGALASDAVHLFVSQDANVSTIDRGEGGNGRLVFVLRDGRLVQEPARTSGSPADTRPSHSG